jgi:hypothetical protein
MTPPPMSAPPMAPQPVARKTSPLVWILVAIFGFFALCGIAVVGLGFFVAHKAKQAGFDAELMQRNPGLAVSKMIAATNPDIDVLHVNDRDGTITLRNRKDGKVLTLSFDDVKSGKFRMSATDETGKTATFEAGDGAGKLPSWVPAYPGAKSQGNFTATGDDGSGRGAGGMVSLVSSDSPSQVLDFYKQKVEGAGLKVINVTSSDDGGMIVANDDDSKRSVQVLVGKNSSGTTIAITFGEKK